MSFSAAVQFVLAEEGGSVNDPRDPGGLTKYGISSRSHPEVDVRNLTEDGACRIYKKNYWDKLPDLPPAIMFVAFDFAVNAGVSRSIKTLQLAIDTKPDGDFGPKSKAALDSMQLDEALMLFCAERARYYALLDDLDDIYARGWMRRTFRAYKEAQRLILRRRSDAALRAGR